MMRFSHACTKDVRRRLRRCLHTLRYCFLTSSFGESNRRLRCSYGLSLKHERILRQEGKRERSFFAEKKHSQNNNSCVTNSPHDFAIARYIIDFR